MYFAVSRVLSHVFVFSVELCYGLEQGRRRGGSEEGVDLGVGHALKVTVRHREGDLVGGSILKRPYKTTLIFESGCDDNHT